MRCPKCKFISFDDLSSCAKCSNDLSALALDLKGTGTEARVAFFLGSVVQAQDLDDDTFSNSQAMTPLDDSNLSFDDTLSGTTDTLGLDLDASLEVAPDDIAIELGDQMPVDLGEIDMSGTGDIDFDASLTLGDTETKSSVDVTTKSADLDEINFNDDIDLNLTSDFDDDSLADFDATEILSVNDSESLSDDNLDLDLTGSFENKVELDFGEVDLDATGMSLSTDSMTTPQAGSALDLDEDLLAELADDSMAPGSPIAPDPAVAGEGTLDFDMSTELTDLSADETPDLDLSGEFSSIEVSDQEETMSSDDIDALLDDFDDDLSGLDDNDLDDLDDLDLDDDFGSLDSDSTEADSPSLDFGDLDVSDLVASGDDTSAIEIDDLEDEVDLSSLMDETPAGTGDDDDFDLDMLDSDLPEIELVDEDK